LGRARARRVSPRSCWSISDGPISTAPCELHGGIAGIRRVGAPPDRRGDGTTINFDATVDFPPVLFGGCWKFESARQLLLRAGTGPPVGRARPGVRASLLSRCCCSSGSVRAIGVSGAAKAHRPLIHAGAVRDRRDRGLLRFLVRTFLMYAGPSSCAASLNPRHVESSSRIAFSRWRLPVSRLLS